MFNAWRTTRSVNVTANAAAASSAAGLADCPSTAHAHSQGLPDVASVTLNVWESVGRDGGRSGGPAFQITRSSSGRLLECRSIPFYIEIYRGLTVCMEVVSCRPSFCPLQIC